MQHDKSTESFDQPIARMTELPMQVGKYTIRGMLGSGMSDVLLGWDEILEREVAVKILRQKPRQHASTKITDNANSLIVEEARKIASLNIDGVATVYECDSVLASIGDATIEIDFMAYEKIDGETLGHWCMRSRPDGRQIARMFLKIAEILEKIHAKQIYHRDIKPANILVNVEGRPIVIDFGLAMLSYGGLATEWNKLRGTLKYMSPEQASCRIADIDGRSDLFSFGVTFYQMLCGKLPFDSPNQGRQGVAEMIEAICHRSPQPLRQIDPNIPLELEAIVLRLLEKERNDRFANAHDACEALRGFLNIPNPDGPQSYLMIVQTRDKVWGDTECERTARFFGGQQPPIDSTGLGPLTVCDPQMNSRGNLWRDLLDRSMTVLNAAKAAGEIVHLVPRINTMCAFALGTRMNNQFPCVLYHCQHGQLYRLWQIDRKVKNKRSPVAGNQRDLEFFLVTDEERSQRNKNPGKTMCLAVEVGANPLLADVARWRSAMLPEVPIRVLTKRCRELSPDATDEWLAAASEISHAVKVCEADELYLFFDMPATLALMAGDALGSWAGKKMHAMQFVDRRDSVEQLPYIEIDVY